MKIDIKVERLQPEEDNLNLDLSINVFYPHLVKNQIFEITPTIIYGTLKRKLSMLRFRGHLYHRTIMNVLYKKAVPKINKFYEVSKIDVNDVDIRFRYSFMHQIPNEVKKVGVEIVSACNHNLKKTKNIRDIF